MKGGGGGAVRKESRKRKGQLNRSYAGNEKMIKTKANTAKTKRNNCHSSAFVIKLICFPNWPRIDNFAENNLLNDFIQLSLSVLHLCFKLVFVSATQLTID